MITNKMTTFIYLLSLFLGCFTLYANDDVESVKLTPLTNTQVIENIRNNDCRICLCPFGDEGLVQAHCMPIQNDIEQQNEPEQTLHIFHEHCIAQWLIAKNECPLCKRVFKEDSFYQSLVIIYNNKCERQQIINASTVAVVVVVVIVIKFS